MKTLITGSSGFIGSHVMEAFEGVAFDRRDHVSRHLMNTPLLKDIFKKVDRIVHLAALTSAPYSITYPKDYWNSNVEGTRNVAKFSGPLFFASSAAVYDVMNPYGLTKKVSEHDLKNRPDTCIGRFFNVFGERDKKSVVYHFISKALKNEPLTIYGDGQQTRCFIYVKDLVEKIEFKKKTKDIGYPQSIKIIDLADLIIDWCGSKSEIIYQSARDGDPYESRSKSKAKYTYGFERGMERTIKHIRDNIRNS